MVNIGLNKGNMVPFTLLPLAKLLEYILQADLQHLFLYLTANTLLRLTTKAQLSKHEGSAFKIHYFH